MKIKLALAISLLVAPILSSVGTPPTPPKGMRWILQQQFSDEFNGDQLDLSKWNNYYPGWEGRPPAKFLPKAISVSDGTMQIKNGVMDKPEGPYRIYGGAVTSKLTEAHYGYYECRAKASRINMSTTFWMSNGKVSFDETENCSHDLFSQELDIQEAVGGSQKFPGFRTEMHSNTHYRYIECGEKREKFYSKGATKKLNSEVWEDFHTYAAWWVNDEVVKFYADDEFFQTVKFTKEIAERPFYRPMHINMVTETYDWQPEPSYENLKNDKINTSFYDWIRSYRLVPVNEQIDPGHIDAIDSENKVEIYQEMLEVEGFPDSLFVDSPIQFQYKYKANEDRRILVEVFQLIPKKRTLLQKSEFDAYAGFGYGESVFRLNFEPHPLKHYGVRFSLVSSSDVVLDWVEFDVSR